ncbi:hypothetical protein BCR42DRAFT_418624 [Absidia repens]|uniref:DUF3020 domain-containing protein n=1 Tax=Absidia repens TaxID=90262 RepID=A0A1X2IBX2_9FUNG|nr:hypothetical protein BCR42DRAFT_418624 [Absidia repens]
MSRSPVSPSSTTDVNKTSEHQATSDHYTAEGDLEILAMNKITSPLSIPSIVTKAAPRSPDLSHNSSTPITAMIKLESNDIGETNSMDTTNTATILPYIPIASTFIPGVDDNSSMADTLLRTGANTSAPNITDSATPMDTKITRMALMDISQFDMSTIQGVPRFDFIQAHEAITQTDSILPSTSACPVQQQLPATIPIENIDDKAETQLQQHAVLVAEKLRKEIYHQKIKNDNRERKKRWREQNEERNKNNDLRCRVNKRAYKLFGKEDSEQKQRWAEEEFVKRQCRRKDKERRRTVMDDAVSSTTHSPSVSSASKKKTLPRRIGSHATPEHLPALQEVYKSVLFNDMKSFPPAMIRKLMQEMQLLETPAVKFEFNQEHALPQLADFLHQLQQLLLKSSNTLSTQVVSPSVSPAIKSGTLLSAPTSTIAPINESVEASKRSSTGNSLSEEMMNFSVPTRISQSVLEVQSTKTTASLSGPPSSNTDTMICEPSMQQSVTQQESLSTESDELHGNSGAPINQTTTSMTEKSLGTLDATIPTSTTHYLSDRSFDKCLSGLLIKTLQQTTLLYQENSASVAAPLTTPVTTEYNGAHKYQHLLRPYSLNAIMTLRKINTEWTKQ